jgi:hypothetical protein
VVSLSLSLSFSLSLSLRERESKREKDREGERKRETFPSFQYKFAQAEINNVRAFILIACGTKSRKTCQKRDFLYLGHDSDFFILIFFFTKIARTTK